MFIHHYLEDRGVCPSFDEMKEALDLKSKSGIHRLITGLTERGFIRRLPHRARALEVLKLPDAVLPEGLKNRNTKPNTGSPKENVVQAEFGSRNGESSSEDNGIVNLPLYGRIAAGLAIEAVTGPGSFVDVPQSMFDGGKHYCLEVAGDSMINAGIHDGDTVVIRDSNTAENGAIVVALIDNEEVTLKRLHRKGNTVALEAENPEYETRIFGPDRVKVQGKLVGLFRQY